MRATDNVATTYYCNNNTLLRQKQMCCFIYSLLVQIMYIIVNKATFTVRENPKAYIKNNINPINTTSLSHSKSYVVKWQHTLLDPFPMNNTILYLL